MKPTNFCRVQLLPSVAVTPMRLVAQAFQLSNFRRSGAGTSAKPWRLGRPGPLGSGYSIYIIYNI